MGPNFKIFPRLLQPFPGFLKTLGIFPGFANAGIGVTGAGF
jgi:hypothetical protein